MKIRTAQGRLLFMLAMFGAATLVLAQTTVAYAYDEEDDDDLDDDDDDGDDVGDDDDDPWGLDDADIGAEDVADADEPETSTSSDSELILKTPHLGKRDNVFDVHGGFTYYGIGFGGGARYTLQLVKNGFIKSLNNSFGIGFGVDFFFNPAIGYFAGPNLSILVPVVVQWAFYLTEDWTVFAEAGVALWFRFGRRIRINGVSRTVGAGGVFDPFFTSGVGAMWNFSKNMSLIIRLTYPYVSVGVTLPILR